MPGFGSRGTEGKIKAINYARVNNVPFLGICFGLQLAVVEFARNVVGLQGAHSTEIDPNAPHPVVTLLDEQKKVTQFGGTMRLGAQRISLVRGTLAHSIYGKDVIYERHRHRYEVNPSYVDLLQKHGLTISGISDNGLVEMIELKDHRFFIATQAHPEFKSRPLNPAPYSLVSSGPSSGTREIIILEYLALINFSTPCFPRCISPPLTLSSPVTQLES